MNSRATAAAGRPRNADLETRMDKLLAAAATLFMERGYSGASLEMIAREARVAVRTIYIEFGGKSGLLSAVITRGRETYAAHLGDLASDTRPLMTVLTEFGMRFLELISAPASIALQRMVIAEAHRNPELGETA
jgi:TetR/AcrR family transcriptional repressor of mexJK operon